MHRLVSLGSLVVVALALSGTASSRTLWASPQCGDTITTSVTLTKNLVCSGAGLTIAATGDLTLDLNGHTIRGGGSGVGINFASNLSGNPADVTVENGTVRTFGTGIFEAALGVQSIELENLTLAYNADFGFECFAPQPLVTISDSTISNNLGVGLLTDCESHVVDNHINWNGGNGLRSPQDSLRVLEGNDFEHNGEDGASIENSVATISGNSFLHNDAEGLDIDESTCGYVSNYVVTDNLAVGNSGGGMRIHVGPFGCDPIGSGNIAYGNIGFDCDGIYCEP